MSTHAINNANGWLETINEITTGLKRLDQNDAEPVTIDDETFTTADDLRERAQEKPLEIAVRGDWHRPGDECDPAEYYILLSTGGPALRIVGELNEHNEPLNARLQWQNWFTPWTNHDHPKTEAVLQFAALFYYGE